MNTENKKISITDIYFKELSKSCKTQEDLSALTKQFMKNMIEGMLQAELEDHLDQKMEALKTTPILDQPDQIWYNRPTK